MKKGFTLIELLAVIVILAIIALIATPIILGIINDAREESNERSVELYASAVRNAIASYQLTHPNTPTSFEDLDIQYDGNVVCATKELYEDGSFYITGCTVNDGEKTYTQGIRQQVYKPQYYSWSSVEWIGDNLPSDAKSNAEEIDTKGNPFYLGYDVDSNNKVTAAYVCFVINGIEDCLKTVDTNAIETNKKILAKAFKDVDNACTFRTDYSYCVIDNLEINLYLLDGIGGVDANNNNAYCSTGGYFRCNQL